MEINMSDSCPVFDVLIFAQQWPPTICYNLRDRYNLTDSCCGIPEGIVHGKGRWSIHGLWPKKLEKGAKYTHSHDPIYCGGQFNIKSLRLIESQLRNVFFDVKDTNIYPFLQRVYEKHGSCMKCYATTENEFKYFYKQLELKAKYDMTKILADINICPGYSYLYGEIHDALEEHLGKRCRIICTKNSRTQHWFVSEIYLYFNKSFKMIDAEDHRQLSNDTTIYYAKNTDDIKNETYIHYDFHSAPFGFNQRRLITERDVCSCQLL